MLADVSKPQNGNFSFRQVGDTSKEIVFQKG